MAAPTAATSAGAPTKTELACCAMLGLTIQISTPFLKPAGTVLVGPVGLVGGGTGTLVGNVGGTGCDVAGGAAGGAVAGAAGGAVPGAGGNVTAGLRVSPLLSNSFESIQPRSKSLVSIATAVLLLLLQALNELQ